MSKDVNKCLFIGRLGKDPEQKAMPNGNAVVNFSIACSDDYKDKQTGQKVEQTNWIKVVAFGKLAEIIGQYCTRGSRVYVEGKLTERKWQDQSGADRYTTEIVASEMQMLDSRQDGAPAQRGGQQQAPQRQAPPQQQSAPPPPAMDQFDDDIPFS